MNRVCDEPVVWEMGDVLIPMRLPSHGVHDDPRRVVWVFEQQFEGIGDRFAILLGVELQLVAYHPWVVNLPSAGHGGELRTAQQLSQPVGVHGAIVVLWRRRALVFSSPLRILT